MNQRMRFLHTSDWHLGKSLCNASLLDDQAQALEEVLRAVKDARPDAFILAGDVYDRAVPPKEAVSLLDAFLVRLIQEEKVPVLMIAGNHDSPERLAFGSRFLGEQKLHVAGHSSLDQGPVILGSTAFHLLPYGDPATVRADLEQEAIRTHQDALGAQLALARKLQPKGKRSVVIAHAFVRGGLTSESESALSIGGAGEVDARLFEGFDYVALGHLHRPQDVGGDSRLRYAGSLLKYSASEASHVKALTLVELPAKGGVRTEPMPISARRDLRKIRGLFQDLLMGTGEGSREDYLFIELTDRHPVLDAMARLRQVYPNLLGLESLQDRELDPGSWTGDHRSLDPETLFARFFQETTGDELTPEEQALYREITSGLGRNP